MKKPILYILVLVPAFAFSKTKSEVHEPSAVELQMACKRLHSAKNIRDEWELDYKQASEKWMEVKQIETAFEALDNCQEKTNSLHEALGRTETLLSKEAVEAAEELDSFSVEGQKCKSKEKAERLRLVLNRVNSRIQEFKSTGLEAGELFKKQVAIAEGLESVRKLPGEIDPKVEAMKERMKNAQRAKQALQKHLDEVVRLEKKYEAERNSLVEKYQGTKVPVPPPQICDKGSIPEWLTETDRLTGKINDMITQSVDLKPTLLNTLKCKPHLDEAILEKIHSYPKKLQANVETRRGEFIVQRCLATASFYDEVSKSVDQGEEAERNRRRMKEKEESDVRRASSTPSLRRQTDEKRQGTETASNQEGGR